MSIRQHPTALVADDEPLLRDSLVRLLANEWPELEVIATARNGREAIEFFETRAPDICFLDVHMPGLSGVEAARLIGRRAHLVFVTAYSEYAVQAFEQGALDYLVKPVEPARLAETVARLKERLGANEPARFADALLERLQERLSSRDQGQPLQWIRASVGATVRLIPVESIDFLRSEEKYTTVAWHADGVATEAVVRTPLKELATQLDASQFVQVHRSVIVNLRAIDHVTRGENETASVHLKGRDEVLPVSRNHLHHFKQM